MSNLLQINDDTVINPNRIMYAFQTFYGETGDWRTTIVFFSDQRLTITGKLADMLKKIELWERGMDD